MNSLSDLILQKVAELDSTLPSTSTPTSLEDNNLTGDEDNQAQTNNSTNHPIFDLEQVKAAIYCAKDQLDGILRLLDGNALQIKIQENPTAQHTETGETIVEGVFDGEKMIGPDGQEYRVPPNYASKSKLVEGDMMKLTITKNGAFVYKQIGPVERKRLVGELFFDSSSGRWSVLVSGRSYKILTASATFYKGKSGDEVTILVPEDGQSGWGAVDNIIAKSENISVY